MSKGGGFTLIELIMVIVILGILAVVAIPKYYDLTVTANAAAENGTLGGVRAGIHTYLAQNRVFPGTLDAASNAVCSGANPCFGTVLSQGGITSQWTKTGTFTYTGPTTTAYTYNNTTGSFQ